MNTNKTTQPEQRKHRTRCLMNPTIRKAILPPCPHIDGRDTHKQTKFGWICNFAEGGEILTIDPLLLTHIEWTPECPEEHGASIDLSDGTIITTHERPEEIAAIFTPIFLNLWINSPDAASQREQERQNSSRN
ncbi:MAG: hypothetical protein IJU53_03850 [Thermoguttaceae bacterium]|nr:hypothetical protein [Thermoguttaceae bacterium]